MASKGNEDLAAGAAAGGHDVKIPEGIMKAKITGGVDQHQSECHPLWCIEISKNMHTEF